MPGNVSWLLVLQVSTAGVLQKARWGEMQSPTSSQPLDVAVVPLVLGEHCPCLRRQEGKKPLLPRAALEMPAGVRTGLTALDGSRRGAWRWFNCAFAILWDCFHVLLVMLWIEEHCVRMPGGEVWSVRAHCIPALWLQGMHLASLPWSFASIFT